jgi:hypothetical protein
MGMRELDTAELGYVGGAGFMSMFGEMWAAAASVAVGFLFGGPAGAIVGGFLSGISWEE